MIACLTLPIVAGSGASLPAVGDTIKLIVGEAAVNIRIAYVIDETRLGDEIVAIDVIAEIEACQDDSSAE